MKAGKPGGENGQKPRETEQQEPPGRPGQDAAVSAAVLDTSAPVVVGLSVPRSG